MVLQWRHPQSPTCSFLTAGALLAEAAARALLNKASSQARIGRHIRLGGGLLHNGSILQAGLHGLLLLRSVDGRHLVVVLRYLRSTSARRSGILKPWPVGDSFWRFSQALGGSLVLERSEGEAREPGCRGLLSLNEPPVCS